MDRGLLFGCEAANTRLEAPLALLDRVASPASGEITLQATVLDGSGSGGVAGAGGGGKGRDHSGGSHGGDDGACGACGVGGGGGGVDPTQVRALRQAAASCWARRGHPGWAVVGMDTASFEQMCGHLPRCLLPPSLAAAALPQAPHTHFAAPAPPAPLQEQQQQQQAEAAAAAAAAAGAQPAPSTQPASPLASTGPASVSAGGAPARSPRGRTAQPRPATPTSSPRQQAQEQQAQLQQASGQPVMAIAAPRTPFTSPWAQGPVTPATPAAAKAPSPLVGGGASGTDPGVARGAAFLILGGRPLQAQAVGHSGPQAQLAQQAQQRQQPAALFPGATPELSFADRPSPFASTTALPSPAEIRQGAREAAAATAAAAVEALATAETQLAEQPLHLLAQEQLAQGQNAATAGAGAWAAAATGCEGANEGGTGGPAGGPTQLETAAAAAAGVQAPGSAGPDRFAGFPSVPNPLVS